MSARPAPKVGDTVWLLAVGNRASRYKESELEEARVLKIGRKYFTVATLDFLAVTRCHEQFEIESWTQKSNGYSADYAIYSCPEERAMEKESAEIKDYLRKLFDHWSKAALDIDQLRRIKAITGEGK